MYCSRFFTVPTLKKSLDTPNYWIPYNQVWFKIKAKVFILLMLLPNLLLGQTTKIQSENVLTPSPIVASLGSYGGLDVKKTSGGAGKSISLFNLSDGDISYNPVIEYFSSGVKVDDWGGRLGMNWTDNFTCIVSRTVKSIPDERATERVQQDVSVLSELSQSNYERIERIYNSNKIHQGLDAEYDIFSFNLFGQSGTFIIKNNQAVLLNHTQLVDIKILSSNPLKLCITKTNGEQYYFGLNSEVELTSFSNENLCDQNSTPLQNVPTSWFLSKIVSPKGRELNFQYGHLNYSYIYDVNESFKLKYLYDIGELIACFDSEYYEATPTFCHREKSTSTYYLTRVESQSFKIDFEYSERSDLVGEKLLNKIKVLDQFNQPFNQVEFILNRVNSTTDFEQRLLGTLGNSNIENSRLTYRYFLTALKMGLGTNQVNHSFGYLNAELLPHRFSLSQDLYGYYNGMNNESLIPADEVAKHSLSYPKVLLHNVPRGNRNPSAFSRYGLLNEIVYPTKGVDSIYYEQNSFTKKVDSLKFSTIADFVGPSPNMYEWSSFSEEFTVPYNQNIQLKVNPDYFDHNLPREEDRDLYYVEFQLWDLTHNVRKMLAGADANNWVRKDILNNYLDSAYVESNTRYEIRFRIYNYKTYLSYEIKYGSQKLSKLLEVPFYGNRVKKIVSYSTPIDKQTLIFDYKRTYNNLSVLSFSDSISIQVTYPINGHVTTSLAEFYCPSFAMVDKVRFHYFSSKSQYSSEIFNGLPCIYDNVTQFMDEGKTSFISSRYAVSSNEDGSVLIGNYTPFIPLSNPAWNNGLELNRFYGEKANGVYFIKKEMRWKYSVGLSKSYDNYIVNKEYDQALVPTLTLFKFLPYTVIYLPVYSKWWKLDELKEISYFGNQTVNEEKKFYYNLYDKMLSSEETDIGNNQKKALIIKRPKSMVDLGLDPNGVYASMVNKFILEPEIEKVTLKGTSLQTGFKRINYQQLSSGIFAPSFVELQRGSLDPLRVVHRYYKYDNIGNLLSHSDENGLKVNYLWSYGSKYPVSEIKNVDYEQIENILGAASISSFSNITNPDKTDIDSFLTPLKNAISGGQLSSYSYKPLVGMTSMTDIKGNSTYYEYDNSHRLKVIKDQNGDLIKQFCYNYAGQSIDCEGLNREEASGTGINLLNSTSQSFNIRMIDMNDGTPYFFSIVPGINNIEVPLNTSYRFYIPSSLDVLSGTLKVSWGCSLVDSSEWLLAASEIYLEDWWLSSDVGCENKIHLTY